MTLIKTLSGIRGTIGGHPDECLNPLDIVKYATAFALFLGARKMVVGRDSRQSGPMVRDIVVGTLVAKTFTDEEMEAADHYVLTANNQFVWVKDAGTIGANKCWLELPTSAASNARAIVFAETTGVKEVREVKEVNDDSFYDLNGRKVNIPTKKGIYILNGKKVVVK